VGEGNKLRISENDTKQMPMQWLLREKQTLDLTTFEEEKISAIIS
jgi:hypothetical protein